MVNGQHLKILARKLILPVMNRVLLYMPIIKHYFLLQMACWVIVAPIYFSQEKDPKEIGVYRKILGIPSIPFMTKEHCSLLLMQRQLIMQAIVQIVKGAWTFIVLYYQK